MTDYKLACPDCGHDASEHDWMCADVISCGAVVEMDGAKALCNCPRTAASLYAAECARISGHLAKLQEAHAVVWAERDAARAECERMRDERRMANRPVLVTEWDLLVAERDRYKAALERITDFEPHEPACAQIARTALDAGKENDNG